MNFTGRGMPMTRGGFDAARDILGCGPSHLWAVLEVESVGFGFLQDRRPKVLLERHWFHRLTKGRFTNAANANISHPEPGGYRGGAAEYERLSKALTLDEDAALKSASFGAAQLMGFNHVVGGHATVQGMVTAFCADEDAHLAAMARFIAADPKMAAALRSGDWAGFARRYNGPGYAKNRYDAKLAEAYAKSRTPDLDLRAAQAGLTFLGFGPGAVDGLMGKRTTAAIADFQRGKSLPATGILDDVTAAMIDDAAFPKPAPAPKPSPTKRVSWWPLRW